MNLFKELFQSSSNLQTEETQQEFATRTLSAIIGIGLLAGTLLVLILNVLTELPVAPFIPLMLVLLATHTTAWLFIKNGYWKTARYIPPIIFLFAGTSLTTNPDLNSISILSYVLSILLTAILFNARMQWAMIVLCSLAYLGAPLIFNISLSNSETNIRYVNVMIFGVMGVIQQITAAIITQTITQLMLETENRKRSEESALQKEGILSAIGQSAQLLLDAQDWESKIEDILRLLGTVSGASHAYLFQNHQDENAALVTSLKYQWSNPSHCKSSDLHAFQNIPLLEEEMIEWYNLMVIGSPYYDSTEDFPAEWFSHEGRSKIKTLLDVPIFVDGEWWGVIGFDDCMRTKPWSQAEVDALQVTAGLLGSSIKKQNSINALIASEDKFQKTFHETLVPMIISRLSDRIILDANEAFAKLTGYSREEMINRWVSLFDLWQNNSERALHRQLIHEQGFIHEFKTTLRKRDGTIGVVLLSVSKIKIDNEDSLLYTISEITNLEKALNDLQSKNNELERFTYTVSHDLKAPLITIGGFMGLLQKDMQTGDTQKIENSMRRIMDAVGKMEQILNELLELSRIGRMVNEPVKVPFEEIVKEALSLTQGRLSANKIEVKVEADLPVVKVDRVRLVEVIQNLLDNAAKFMGDQPKPEISIGMRRSMQGERVFIVADNGIGIEPVYHERVFGLFNKLDANTEGTGIGLAIVRRIIEFHGGRIWVESNGKGKGTSFCFTLPRP